MTDVLTPISPAEAQELELLLEGEPGCTWSHNGGTNNGVWSEPECSHVAALVMKNCVGSFLTCANMAVYLRLLMSIDNPCLHCGRSDAECWQLLPL